MIFAVLNP